jgi:AsmA protein
MRRWLIAVGVGVVVVGAIFAVAIAHLGRFVTAHREWLATQLEDEIGRPVTFGDLGVSLRGGPGVRITDLHVPEDPSYGSGDLLHAREVRVTVRLWPALRGRFEIGRILLGGPVLTVIRDQRGFNLDTLGRKPRREHEHREGHEPRPEFPLLVGLLDVRDGVVRYVDRRVEPARELALEGVDVAASDVTIDRPIALVATAALAGTKRSQLQLTGSVGPLRNPPDLGPMLVDLRLEMPTLDGTALSAVTAALDLPLPADVSLDGPLAIEASAQGTLDQLSLEGRIDATPAAVRWGRDFAKLGDLPCEADVSGARNDGETVIRRAKVRLGDAQFDATGTMRPHEPVDVRIDSNHAALSDLAAAFPALAGAEVGGGVEAHLTVRGKLLGVLATDPPPAISGTVALDGVRARRPHDTLGVSDLSTTIAVGDGVARMPATRFRLGDAPVEASGAFVLADRVLTVDHAAGELFGGSAEGSARIDLRHDKHRAFTLDATARRVALQPLLAAFGARVAPHVEGLLDASASLTGGGRPAIRRSLAGTVRTEVHDGVVHGVNLVDQVLGGITGVERIGTLAPESLRAKHPELFGAADTRFEELRATTRIADGQARTDDLVMRSPSYTVTGSGTAGLDGSLDLTAKFVAGSALTADIVGSIRDARWAANDQQLLEVPFRLTGRLPDVRVRPDPAFVARVVGSALVDRANRALGGQKGGKDAKKDLVDEAVRGLQKLLGR